MSKFENDENLIKVNGEMRFKLLDVLNSKSMTRYKLHRITGIRYDTICNYCSGKVTLLNKEYLKNICDVLDCSISDIIEYKKNSK